jgi:tripartite-type tricarboxylate transporter receptor subunit TctC
MPFVRITTGAFAAFAAGFLLIGIEASAQTDEANYPERAIRVIVSVPAGGGVDTVTRLIGQKLQQRLGQPVVIENRGGAAGNIGAEAVANAAPDGYTLMASSPAPLAINAALYKKLKYDGAAFEPVAVMALSPNVLVVRPDLAVKSVQEVIAFAKATPATLTYASQGNGTTSHLTAELFQRLTGTRLQHVPYRGTAPALNDLIAGHVDLMFVDVTAALSLHQAGKVRILATATSRPLAEQPDIPTFEQAGVTGFLSTTWNAITAPPNTPASITSLLNREINAILELPEIEARFRELHLIRAGGSRADMADFVKAERRRWEEIVRSANITLE